MRFYPDQISFSEIDLQLDAAFDSTPPLISNEAYSILTKKKRPITTSQPRSCNVKTLESSASKVEMEVEASNNSHHGILNSSNVSARTLTPESHCRQDFENEYLQRWRRLQQ